MTSSQALSAILSSLILVCCSGTHATDCPDPGCPDWQSSDCPGLIDGRTVPADGVLTDARQDSQAGDSDLSACPWDAGCPGSKCDSDADCGSGLCVLHEGDRACAATCDGTCPAGFDCVALSGRPFFGESFCLSRHPSTCFPCDQDGTCRFMGHPVQAKCVNFGSDVGGFCGTPCGIDTPCPGGYSCQLAVTLDGQVHPLCLPVGGSCECPPYALENHLSTSCVKKNGFGVCNGVRECAWFGLTECDAPIPAEEQCDGLDNDCDGGTDENTCQDPSNPCVEGTCYPESGCSYEILDGSKCLDNDACTEDDACVLGECAGTPVDCNDGQECTYDTCDPELGCYSLPYQGPCDDGDACTLKDQCTDGVCVGQGHVICDDGNSCTEDYCLSDSGCQFIPNDVLCDDGNLCTDKDMCIGVWCLGKVVDCDDEDACTTDTCISDVGCVHQAIIDPPECP